jgi:hypothetical protein
MRSVMGAAPEDRSRPRSRAELLDAWSRLFGETSRRWWLPSVIGRPDLAEADVQALEDLVLDEIEGRHAYDPVYLANFAFDLRAALARVTAPTLVVELATPRERHLARQGDAIVAMMHDCRSCTIDRDDATLLRDEPELLAAVVLGFLSGAHPG